MVNSFFSTTTLTKNKIFCKPYRALQIYIFVCINFRNRARPGCEIVSETFCLNNDETDKIDLTQALYLCDRFGGRLCSQNEIEGNCATDNECGFNNKMVWILNPGKHYFFHLK